jgi:hypothetical protein
MKLNEIIKTSHKQAHGGVFYNKKLKQKAQDSDNHGLYSFVTHDEDDPHIVTKYGKETLENSRDGFIKYAQEIKRRRLWEKNIHFPRIYTVTDTTDATPTIGGKYRSWKIEKLTKLRSCSTEQLNAMSYQYFGKEYESFVSKTSIITNICKNIENFLYGISDTPVIDNEFKQACLILRDIREKINIYFDIHDGNLMVRVTPVGTQIVFTDPFGFNGNET